MAEPVTPSFVALCRPSGAQQALVPRILGLTPSSLPTFFGAQSIVTAVFHLESWKDSLDLRSLGRPPARSRGWSWMHGGNRHGLVPDGSEAVGGNALRRGQL